MCISFIHCHDERVLRHCQVKVDLILDEVESKVCVDSTEFVCMSPEMMVGS
jgi:hypothetical protein